MHQPSLTSFLSPVKGACLSLWYQYNINIFPLDTVSSIMHFYIFWRSSSVKYVWTTSGYKSWEKLGMSAGSGGTSSTSDPFTVLGSKLFRGLAWYPWLQLPLRYSLVIIQNFLLPSSITLTMVPTGIAQEVVALLIFPSELRFLVCFCGMIFLEEERL